MVARVLVCLVGPSGPLLRHRTPLKVRDSFSEQHATVGPGIAHIHTDTPGSWCRVGMPAVCTVGPRVNADNGRSDVPQEPKSLQASAKEYYVLGE